MAFGGLPDEAKAFEFSGFAGLKTRSPRSAIDDQDLAWCENFFPIAPGNMRALYGKGATLYTAANPPTIKWQFAYNIGTTSYHAVFLSDGTAVQVRDSDGAITTISSTANTFYAGNGLPHAAQFGSSGIVIASPASANGYWAWDGTTLFASGSASPSWLNGGTATTMPTGIKGTAVEVFQSRIWIANGGSVSFSAPNNGANFATSAGGGVITSVDSFLRNSFVALKQANGFLYLFGDSSINVISNVSTSGSPPTTTFNNANTDPQVGTPWRDSILPFGRGLMLANSNGIYALLGGAAEKISDNVEVLYGSAALPLGGDAVPSAALSTLFGIRVYMLLIPVNDPFTGATRNILIMWDGKKLFLGSQEKALLTVGVQEMNSLLTAWGTDGIQLFPLFSTPSTALTKHAQGKLWAGEGFVKIKQVLRIYSQAQGLGSDVLSLTVKIDGDAANISTTLSGSNTISFTNASGAVIQFQNASSQNINFTVGGLTIAGEDFNMVGKLIGLDVQSTTADFSLNSIALLYRELAPFA